MNLYELIKKNNFQGFTIALIRRFAFSLLQCLKVLQREKIIHCDLKPVSKQRPECPCMSFRNESSWFKMKRKLEDVLGQNKQKVKKKFFFSFFIQEIRNNLQVIEVDLFFKRTKIQIVQLQ